TAERFADPSAREVTRELVSTLMDLHGAALARLVELAASAGESGRAPIDAGAPDELGSRLLLLYGPHPPHPSTRVRAALEKVRPRLRAHGSDVELLAAEVGSVRLRLTGRGDETFRHVVEEAVYEAAPDAEEVVVENADVPGLIPLPLLGART